MLQINPFFLRQMLCLLFFTASVVVRAQDMVGPNGIAVPKLPSFNSLNAESVNLYTGGINLNIPIYTVEGSTLSLPISMNYATSGIKVGERAGWTGLGWDLRAGGVVEVEQKGGYDFMGGGAYGGGYVFNNSNGYDGFSDVVSGLTTTNNNYSQIWSSFYGQYFNYQLISHANDVRRNQLVTAYMKYHDSEPDIFHFSFGEYSGKFVFNSFGTPYFIPHQSLRVVINSKTSLTFITPDGTKYIFNVTESVNDYSDAARSTVVRTVPVSKYYLSQVVSASGNDVIHLNYDTLSDIHYGSHLQRRYDFLNATVSTDASNLPFSNMSLHIANTESSDVPIGSVGDIPTYSTIMAPKRLSSIVSAKCTLSFNTVTGRQDIPEDTQLDNIRITNSQGNELKTVSFLYQTMDGGCDSNCRRLMLYKMLESVNGTQRQPPYVFSYQSTVGQTQVNLPSLFSNQQDLWGYFNGASSNTHLIPGLTYSGQTFSGANRNPNGAYGQIGLLNKIVYPTGGYTSFSYEGNSYYNAAIGLNWEAGGVRLYQRKDNDGNGTETVKTYTYTQQNDNTKSSGTIDQLPSFYNKIKVNVPDNYDVANYSTSLVTFNQHPGDYYFLETYSEPVIEYGTAQGSPVGYSCVTVTETGKGKTVYVFNSFLSNPDDNNTAVNDCDQTDSYMSDLTHVTSQGTSTCQLPKTSREAERGLLTYVGFFNEARVLQKELFYTYSFTEIFREGRDDLDTITQVPAIRTNVNYNLYSYDATNHKGKLCMPNVNVSGSPNFGYWGYFYYPSEWVQLDSTKEVIYDQGTTANTLVTTTSYEYALANTLPFKITQTNSDQKKFVTTYTYSFDYTQAQAFPFTMVKNNILNPVIEKVVYEVTPSGAVYVLKGEINEYDDVGRKTAYYTLEGSDAKPIPMNNFTFSNHSSANVIPKLNPALWFDDYPFNGYNLHNISNSDTSAIAYRKDPKYVKRASYLYDTYDHVIQTTQWINGVAQGPSSSFIWGYNTMYPIAQVSNATADKIAYTSFETSVSSAWNYDNSSISIFDVKTGNNSYNGAQPITISPQVLSAGKYRLSFWAANIGSATPGTVSVTVTGGAVNNVSIIGTSLVYYEVILQDPMAGITLTPSSSISTIYMDELRICPIDAQMETYTYQPGVGPTSQSDANGKVMYYEYDSLNRLSIVRDQDRNILKKMTYGFKQP